VLTQHRDDGIGDTDHTAPGRRLGRSQQNFSRGTFNERRADPHSARLQVQITPLQRRSLTPAQACEGGETHERAIPSVITCSRPGRPRSSPTAPAVHRPCSGTSPDRSAFLRCGWTGAGNRPLAVCGCCRPDDGRRARQGGAAALRRWPGVSAGLSLGRPARRTPGHYLRGTHHQQAHPPSSLPQALPPCFGSGCPARPPSLRVSRSSVRGDPRLP